eukprot:TRINITY_DN13550_c0_g1_i1.p1 TRINITY_DN13550_c0_g1~~TRINITY_DN13550_c0_g1_i1.p1  ORF type:complete len:101 (-),score=6.04 TRINITY_DN13550_c0_g1_i1:122-424(-)
MPVDAPWQRETRKGGREHGGGGGGARGGAPDAWSVPKYSRLHVRSLAGDQAITKSTFSRWRRKRTLFRSTKQGNCRTGCVVELLGNAAMGVRNSLLQCGN